MEEVCRRRRQRRWRFELDGIVEWHAERHARLSIQPAPAHDRHGGSSGQAIVARPRITFTSGTDLRAADFEIGCAFLIFQANAAGRPRGPLSIMSVLPKRLGLQL